MKTITIIQARMTSTRLPSKVIRLVNGKTILEWVIHRLYQVEGDIGPIVVATSNHPTDNPIAELCEKRNIVCYRGSLTDVLDRYHTIVTRTHSDTIIRVTADCPLLSPALLDEILDVFHKSSLDYCDASDETANGLGQEVISADALEQAWKHAEGDDREHIGAYLRRNHGIKYRFRVGYVHGPRSPFKFSIDTPADLERLRTLYDLSKGTLFDLEAKELIVLAQTERVLANV